MKRFILSILVVLFVGSFLGGCSGLHGMAHSQTERKDRFKTIHELYRRQFVDDCDMVALCDRVSYMSEWPIRDTD